MKPLVPQTITVGSREIRRLSHPLEIRAAVEGQEGRTVFGYAAKFNSLSQNMGSKDYQFYEIILPGAFDDVLENDVRALFNHESELILARTKSGTLEIGVDNVGLWYQFDAPETQAGNDLLVSIRRGDIDQSSFQFRVDENGQSWVEQKEGDGPTIITRTISKVLELLDVSPVTYPAYEDTQVDCRSIPKEFTKQEPETPEPIEDDFIAHRQRALDLIDKTARNQN
jgi:uncharacterized protein